MLNQNQRLVVLPDIHCPNHNYTAIASVLNFIKYYKPDILIQLGDFCDWDSISSYEVSRDSDIVTIEREVNSANDLLDQLDKSVGNRCKKIMIGGNHENRYPKFKVNNGSKVEDRRLKEFTSWEYEYHLYDRGWDSFKYGQHVQIGKIVFTHGWFTGSTAAKKMAECFPGRNVIYGHTHQHEVYGLIDEHGLPIESESIGTLSQFNLSYLNGKPATHWVNSFVYIDLMPNGRFSKHFVHIIDGKFIEFGKEFSS